MPVWLIPILMAAMGGAAGQAEGHNTKSTLEGAGLGALLGVGGGAAGLLGAGSEGATAGTSGALAGESAVAPEAMGASSDALSASLAAPATAAGMPTADSLGLNGLIASGASGPAAGGGDLADMSMLGSASTQGVDASNLGAIMGNMNPVAGSTAAGQVPGSMAAFSQGVPSSGSAAWSPTSAASRTPSPSAWQQFVNSPQYQKLFGKAQDAAVTGAVAQGMAPRYTTTDYGQWSLGQLPPIAPQQLSMPGYVKGVSRLEQTGSCWFLTRM